VRARVVEERGAAVVAVVAAAAPSGKAVAVAVKRQMTYLP